MAIEAPFKVLEISIISAEDLPPVSKALRTFSVAYINQDEKLSTKVDHQGHTNPLWNYKVSFRVDDSFLKSESSTITFEIYNVAWLRDVPIGTANLLINNLSPPLVWKHSIPRPVTLDIRSPSGQLQGLLNLTVHLINNNPASATSGSELSASTTRGDEILYNQALENRGEGETVQSKDNTSKDNDSVLETGLQTETTELSYSELGSEMRSMLATSNNSVYSEMRPIPSEVAEDLNRGLYFTGSDEYGSSIFEGWTEPGESELSLLKSRSERWPEEEQIPLRNDYSNVKKLRKAQRMKSEGGGRGRGGGLFSCFGCGFQFSITCGSKSAKKNKKKLSHHHRSHSAFG